MNAPIQPVPPNVEPVVKGQIIVTLIDTGPGQPTATNFSINDQYPTPPVNEMVNMLITALSIVNNKVRADMNPKILRPTMLPHLPRLGNNGKG